MSKTHTFTWVMPDSWTITAGTTEETVTVTAFICAKCGCTIIDDQHVVLIVVEDSNGKRRVDAARVFNGCTGPSWN